MKCDHAALAQDSGALKEITPLCVLDFYIHESCQREGLGHMLMEFMLKDAHETPVNLAYDRPSPKLLSFLSKHYGLRDFLPQNNNFVVFRQYFLQHKKRHAPDSTICYNISDRTCWRESLQQLEVSWKLSGHLHARQTKIPAQYDCYCQYTTISLSITTQPHS
eukprot:scaffold78004_cov45-Prasinocladus_malaysianus.AAC.1